MKIKIESDVFNIVERIREIDDRYYIVFNLNTKKYEVHKNGLKSSYCLTIPYSQLDKRTIKLIHDTHVRNSDKIIKSMEENNEKLQVKAVDEAKEINEYKVKELFRYSGAGTSQINNAFKTTWL